MVLRIFKTIVTSGFQTALECTKFVFGRGSAPERAGGAHSAPWLVERGLLLRGREGKGKREKGRREEGNGTPLCKSLDPPPWSKVGQQTIHHFCSLEVNICFPKTSVVTLAVVYV